MPDTQIEYPCYRWSTILLAMLSLSIGWGIRGNYGHEYGAMIPGMLCAVAVCLFSGREDWRRRVLYFGVFGALGWAFGGSMSYMLTMSYAQSGNLPTQFYGFFAVFAIGFLWASLGGAGTAYAAVEDEDKLTQIFKPLCWILAIWAIHYFFWSDFVRWYEQVHSQLAAGSREFRQQNPFYWLDSDWIEACTALLALCLFDLWDRRFHKAYLLGAYGAAGAAAGFVVQKLLIATGWIAPLLQTLVHYQGDLNAINPATGRLFDPNNLVTNWPQVFFDLGNHLGWIFGLILGLGVYFYRHGRWRFGASLLLHLTVGGLTVFLVGPVLLTNFFMNVGGFRLTPPRGDNWAMVLGVFLGMLVYMYRNNLVPVASAAIVSGLIGGLGFMVAEFVKILAWMPGNPVLTQNQPVIQAWAHWRSANWHSIVAEQGVGLLYGLAIAVAMGMLATRIKPAAATKHRPRWTEVFSVVFILNILLYLNLVKNLGDWTAERSGGFRSMPLFLKAPLFGSIEVSALGWYNIFFALFTICTVALLIAHVRRPLAVVAPSWLGKGQLFYLLFLWPVVMGNFDKALVAFHEQRLATEGTIFVNALIATFLILYFAREHDTAPVTQPADYRPLVRRVLVRGISAMVLFTLLFTAVVHGVYGDRADRFGGRNLRFGPNADWRVRPILKNKAHR